MLVGPNLREDYLERFRKLGKPRAKVSLGAVLVEALRDRGFRGVMLYRMGRYFRVRGVRFMATLLERLNHHLCFCEISTAAEIGPGFSVWHPQGLGLAGGVRAGRNLTLNHDTHIGGNFNKAGPDGRQVPWLGDNVHLTSGARIFGPVTIGDNCRLGALTVVTSDLPPHSVVANLRPRIVKQQGAKVAFLDGASELGPILRELSARVAALEARLAQQEGQVAEQETWKADRVAPAVNPYLPGEAPTC
ncbi:MAG: hypothetical protein V2A79_13915 [Planctomycetota bacterium]